jgi:hypothetical protein
MSTAVGNATRGHQLLLALEQVQDEVARLSELLPPWAVIEPLSTLTLEVCSYYPCGEQATYVVLGPDYPYCTEHLRAECLTS